MGTDTPISALSDKSKLLYTYFKQNFAQVTNPPIDPIREELVMSLVSFIGPRPNLLRSGRAPRAKKRLEVRQPILTNERSGEDPLHRSHQGPLRHQDAQHHLFEPTRARGMEGAALSAVRAGRKLGAWRLQHHHPVRPHDRPGPHPDPALAGDGSGAHHLIRKGLRTSVGLVVETGEAREVHHFACLAGYGAEAINPYLAFDTLPTCTPGRSFPRKSTRTKLSSATSRPIGKGMLKVMSKMGISTYQSYCGAQIFDAVGLSSPFVDSISPAPPP
jgi:glutamate synthase (NADPH/NADH) large chain